jgi:hypothetical protein
MGSSGRLACLASASGQASGPSGKAERGGGQTRHANAVTAERSTRTKLFSHDPRALAKGPDLIGKEVDLPLRISMRASASRYAFDRAPHSPNHSVGAALLEARCPSEASTGEPGVLHPGARLK